MRKPGGGDRRFSSMNTFELYEYAYLCHFYFYAGTIIMTAINAISNIYGITINKFMVNLGIMSIINEIIWLAVKTLQYQYQIILLFSQKHHH